MVKTEEHRLVRVFEEAEKQVDRKISRSSVFDLDYDVIMRV